MVSQVVWLTQGGKLALVGQLAARREALQLSNRKTRRDAEKVKRLHRMTPDVAVRGDSLYHEGIARGRVAVRGKTAAGRKVGQRNNRKAVGNAVEHRMMLEVPVPDDSL